MVGDIQERFDHEILPLEDEALSKLRHRNSLRIRVLTEFNVVSGAYLSLLLNLLSFNLVSHLLTISESIILTYLSQDIGLSN